MGGWHAFYARGRQGSNEAQGVTAGAGPAAVHEPPAGDRAHDEGKQEGNNAWRARAARPPCHRLPGNVRPGGKTGVVQLADGLHQDHALREDLAQGIAQ